MSEFAFDQPLNEAAVVARLTERAEELERFIDDCHRKMRVLESDLSHARAVLTFHEQHIMPEDLMPHMSIRKLLSKTVMLKQCQSALKRADDGGLDTRQLASHVIAKTGLDTTDLLLRKRIVFSVMAVMKSARRKGIVVSGDKRKGVRVWMLREPPMRERTMPSRMV